MAVQTLATPYPARLTIDYTERLGRLTTFFRVIWSIPILIVLSVLTSSGSWSPGSRS
ncbi:MAG: hypothetical protein NVS1B1_08340 [Candidatus Limnocylindrales bacterium]